MVMLERLFLAQEKDLLEEDKRLVEEEPGMTIQSIISLIVGNFFTHLFEM